MSLGSRAGRLDVRFVSSPWVLPSGPKFYQELDQALDQNMKDNYEYGKSAH